MEVENRLYERVVLGPAETLPCEGLGFAFAGKVAVISMGGIYVQGDKSFPVGTVLPLRFRAGEEVVEADCIVRDADAQGLGLEFVKLRGPNEDALRRILERLRP
jgi:hypothetical protein